MTAGELAELAASVPADTSVRLLAPLDFAASHRVACATAGPDALVLQPECLIARVHPLAAGPDTIA
jgi:hypothetical protein